MRLLASDIISVIAAFLLSSAVTPALAGPVAGEQTCGAHIRTSPASLDLKTQVYLIKDTLQCLINAERAQFGLQELKVNVNLTNAATGHVERSTTIKWWGEGNPHVDPDFDIDPATKELLSPKLAIGGRIKRSGYCSPNAAEYREGEITYWGTGSDSTPLAAVNWWMNISKEGHREAILDPLYKELGIAVAGKVPVTDLAANASREQGTYVVALGKCSSNPDPQQGGQNGGQNNQGGSGSQSKVTTVNFNRVFINECSDPIGICDWRLTCRLNAQPDTEIFTMKEADTGDNIHSDKFKVKSLTFDGNFPAVLTCHAQEYDRAFWPFDKSLWQLVGSAFAEIKAGTDKNDSKDDKTLNMRREDENDEVTIYFDAEISASVSSGLSFQPPIPEAPDGCRIPMASPPTCGGIDIECNAPLAAATIFIAHNAGFTMPIYRVAHDIGLINAEYSGEGDTVLAVCAKNTSGMRCSNAVAATLGPTFCPGPPPSPRICPEGSRICRGKCISFNTRCDELQ
ncbi:CAP domain-containing protein [Azotobacter chroococcum]|uniref:CAP domain-containing protein n=1 Tax=Azotobacter chroococcum TaxID=353 RepID=UPI000B77FA4E|nr:CAP domain-containing protein [Azotobacter chroococcum]